MASVLRDDYDDGYGLLFSLSRRLSMANGLTSSGLSWDGRFNWLLWSNECYVRKYPEKRNFSRQDNCVEELEILMDNNCRPIKCYFNPQLLYLSMRELLFSAYFSSLRIINREKHSTTFLSNIPKKSVRIQNRPTISIKAEQLLHWTEIRDRKTTKTWLGNFSISVQTFRPFRCFLLAGFVGGGGVWGEDKIIIHLKLGFHSPL